MPSTVTGNPNNSAGGGISLFLQRRNLSERASSRVLQLKSANARVSTLLPASFYGVSFPSERAWNELSIFWSLTISSTVIPRNLWSSYNTQEDL